MHREIMLRRLMEPANRLTDEDLEEVIGLAELLEDDHLRLTVSEWRRIDTLRMKSGDSR